jgi:fructoselysine and glucoselysine-specific PTS system IIC component
MAAKALLLFLVAFFGYMHSYWGSTMHNRPLIMGTLTGLVLGDLKTGIEIGSALELAFLGAVPIGASNPPNMTSGAVIATAFVILSGADAGMAVTIAIPVATLVALFDNLQMMFLLTWAGHLCDKAAENGDAHKIEVISRVASIGNKLALSLLVALGFYFGSSAIEAFVNWVPYWFSHGMDVVAGILPALGISMLAHMIMTKENWGWLIIGFLISAYLSVSTLGVALLGIAVAGLLFYFDKNNRGSKEVASDDNEF